MKKIIVSAVAVLAVVSNLNSAMAEESKSYISGSIGFSTLSDYDIDVEGVGSAKMKGDDNISLNAAIGYKGANNIRNEFEISYSDFETKDKYGAGVEMDVQMISLSGNAYYDFVKAGRDWTPYVGAGAGITQVKGSDAGGSETDIAPHVQLKAGVSTQISENSSLFADYTFKHVFETSFDANDGTELTVDSLKTQTLSFGVRSTF
ncbi:MAG: porin family protein [Alphaproteobacteria bacterium]|jgi:opacity protein-like surface antigen|nr:porin family protein [Alphaproteobacteria bacterium]